MTAQELFQSGRLDEAVAAQIAQVKQNPSDVDARYALFVYFCFSGELDRASAALQVVASRADKAEGSALLLASLLAAEHERRAVWTEGGTPLYAPDPPAHLLARLRVLESLRAGDAESAGKALDDAIEAFVQTAYVLDRAPIEVLRDADDRLGSVLELFVGGRYVWIPFERIERLTLTPPKNALDLLWLPAQLEDVSGTSSSVYVPALYEGSHAGFDEGVRLGRKTLWIDQGADIHRGVGQRMLLAASGEEEREVPILELRSLVAAARAAHA